MDFIPQNIQSLTIMQGDIAPVPTATLADSNLNPMNLHGATVKFHMQDYYTGQVIVDAPAVVLQNDNIISTWGQVIYYWQTADTATPGMYNAWWITNYGSGPEHFPPDHSFIVVINPS